MAKLPVILFLRIASKNREVYLLKIITLSIAIASSTLVILFSFNEFGYDRFHSGAHSIFRVLERNLTDSHIGNRLSNKIPHSVYTRLESQCRESVTVSRVKIMNGLTLHSENNIVKDQTVHAADPALMDILSFRVIAGTVLDFNTPHTAILSSAAAKRIFGSVHSVGKKITTYATDDTLDFKVAAIFQDFPANAHEDFDLLIFFDTTTVRSLGFSPRRTGVYGRSMFSNPKRLEQLVNRNVDPDDLIYHIQPLPEIYFGPRVSGEESKHGDRYSVIILICISAFILFLALTSYVNLTTLTLPYRSKELALKKLAGANHFGLLLTFLKESFFIVLISLSCGVVLLVLTARLLQPILSIDVIALLSRGDRSVIIAMATILLILILSPLLLTLKFLRASPTRLLSTETITFPDFKKTITILQLGISIFLIVSAIVIKRQINYSLLKEPGRNFEQVVYLTSPDDLTTEGLYRLRSGWKQFHPNIVDVSAISQLPDRINSKETNSPFFVIFVDPYFPDFFDLNMIDGNWFKANAGDSVLVVNEKGMEYMPPQDGRNVIGVIEDISNDFNQPQRPIKFKLATNSDYNYLCVRILEVDIRRTIDYLSASFNNAPVSILNTRFEEWLQYQDRLNMLSNLLAIISALLSCCAIYGLSVSLVRDKLKQIAVHKICGASSLNITLLLAREFIRSTLIAIAIAAPITYLFVRELLNTFVYSTDFQWHDPVIPVVYCALVITFICGFQALSLSRSDLTAALKGKQSG